MGVFRINIHLSNLTAFQTDIRLNVVVKESLNSENVVYLKIQGLKEDWLYFNFPGSQYLYE